VGIHLARRTLWGMIAQILWTIRIEREVGEEGEEVYFHEEVYDDGLLLSPIKSGAQLVVRSERHAEVIRMAARDSDGFLRKWR
jgi:hypothetical protein